MDPNRAENLEADVLIGDFRIERRIGAGGMSVVYLARQISLDRPVALKILGSALDRVQDIHRFQREAQAIAKLNHPGIAAVHFVGQDGQVCYIAMEFIDGVSLRTVIDRLASASDPLATIESAVRTGSPGEGRAPTIRFDDPTKTDAHTDAEEGTRTEPGPLSPGARRLIDTRDHIRRCGEIIREAALALAHAHERGVVHRDIKPENLMLDRDLRVHVIDFGIARFFEDTTLTATGALIGSPMYMSPEQVTGRIGIDPRTDLYSLGLVLYELLSLRRPHTATTREGILRQVVTKPLPPVSWRNRAVPRDLEAVVHKATAKDPDERYQTADDLAADLGNWLDGRPVTATPLSLQFDVREIIADRPSSVTARRDLAAVLRPLLPDGRPPRAVGECLLTRHIRGRQERPLHALGGGAVLPRRAGTPAGEGMVPLDGDRPEPVQYRPVRHLHHFSVHEPVQDRRLVLAPDVRAHRGVLGRGPRDPPAA